MALVAQLQWASGCWARWWLSTDAKLIYSSSYCHLQTFPLYITASHTETCPGLNQDVIHGTDVRRHHWITLITEIQYMLDVNSKYNWGKSVIMHRKANLMIFQRNCCSRIFMNRVPSETEPRVTKHCEPINHYKITHMHMHTKQLLCITKAITIACTLAQNQASGSVAFL